MRRIRDCYRLYFECNLNQSQIAQSLGLARSTVQDYLSRLSIAELNYKAISNMTDEHVKDALFKKHTLDKRRSARQNDELDYEYLHKELAKPGVTLRLLWEEYRKSNNTGYQYSQFCHYFKQWCKTLKVYMRQHHKAGERLFVDYSGKKPCVVNRFTGEITEVELFVMCWGYSNYIYAEAQPSQEHEHWIMGHVRAFKFFECVPQLLVPDNYKGAVSKAHRYDPDVNLHYSELAQHYGVGVVPTRPYHPKDKAKVENSVLIVQRWILARLRNRVFHSIVELNSAIHEQLKDLNNRKMQRVGSSRLELFMQVDRPAARVLPQVPFTYRKCFRLTVNLDYHIEVEKKYYSVPWKYCRKKVYAYLENGILSVFYNEQRIALHNELNNKHSFCTEKEHMPPQHRAMADWSIATVLHKARECGPFTETLIKKIIAGKLHPQQGFRPSQGILRLADAYSKPRLENAARIALELNLTRVQQISDLLKNNRDKEDEQSTGIVENTHNIRGKDYYAQKDGAQ